MRSWWGTDVCTSFPSSTGLAFGSSSGSVDILHRIVRRFLTRCPVLSTITPNTQGSHRFHHGTECWASPL
ncbi:hypothetical protein M3J09_001077 [Ascochyta lentis]